MVGKVEKVTTELSTESETMYLKFKNKTLAKALTEEKMMCKQYLDERNFLQKRVHFLTLLNMRYEDNLKQMSIQCKKMLPNIVAMSDSITEMIKLSNNSKNVYENVTDDLGSPHKRLSSCPVTHLESDTINRTRAVKPMVSGHVILRPTISLRRLTDLERIEQSQNVTNVNAEELSNIPHENVEERNDNVSLDEYRFIGHTVPELTLNLSEENMDENDVLNLEELTENMENMTVPTEENHIPRSLSPVLEEDEPNDTKKSQLSPKEVDISLQQSTTDHSSANISNSNKNQYDFDPLEGPSTLMNNRHFNRTCNVILKRRMCPVDYTDDESLSDSDDDWCKSATKKPRSKKASKAKQVVIIEPHNTANNEPQKSSSKKQKSNTFASSSPERPRNLQMHSLLRRSESPFQNGFLKEARVTISPITLLSASFDKTPNLSESTINNLMNSDGMDSNKNVPIENLSNNNYFQSSIKPEKEPIVVLEQIDDEDMRKVIESKEKLESIDLKNNSKNISSTNERSFIDERPRRNKLVRTSFKEVSLKCKLRRQ